MSARSKIEWTDATWNPVAGCERVSEGCTRCYAIPLAHRFASSPNEKVAAANIGLTARIAGRIDWTGIVRTLPQRLNEPLHWRAPRMIFVNSRSDLFHDDVPAEFIAAVFSVMAATPRHTYQILTKRHARMRSLLADPEFARSVHQGAGAVAAAGRLDERDWGWPLPNVWAGVSVETQQWADIRIPALLATPAAVRWISAEPLLGPVDLEPWLWEDGGPHIRRLSRMALNWVVVGGESGPSPTPMHPAWARQLRDQCADAGVPFQFKQWGGWGPVDSQREFIGGARWIDRHGEFVDVGDRAPDPRTTAGLLEGQARGLQLMQLRAKQANGRRLDGREWLEYPA